MAENIEEKEEFSDEEEILQKNIEDAKEKIKEYIKKNDYHSNFTDFHGNFRNEKEIDESIERGQGKIFFHYNGFPDFNELCKHLCDCENALKFHKLWKDFSPIKSTIESLKEEIGFDDSQDRFAYIFNSLNNMFFIGFEFRHYTGKSYSEKFPNIYTWVFDTLTGCIAYDLDGNIYLLEKSKYENAGGGCSRESGIFNRHFYKQQFFDKEYMCIDDDYKTTKLYRIVDGEYKEVRDFGRCCVETNQELWKEKLLIVGSTNVYSVKENRFLSITANNTEKVQSGYNNKSFVSSSREDIERKKAFDQAEKNKEKQKSFIKSKKVISNNDSFM